MRFKCERCGFTGPSVPKDDYREDGWSFVPEVLCDACTLYLGADGDEDFPEPFTQPLGALARGLLWTRYG